MDEQPKRRFQFSLSELLAIVVLAGLGLLVVGPSVMRAFGAVRYYWPPRAQYWNEQCFVPSMVTIVASCVGAFAGLWCAYCSGVAGWQRAGCLVIGTLMALFCLSGAANMRKCSFSHASAVMACKVFAEGEEIFHRTDYQGSGDVPYAQTLGDMYETKPGAGDLFIVDPDFAAAEVVDGHASARCGYVFRVLKAQGAAAVGGAKKYLVTRGDREEMKLGYALVACPAVYGESGRDLFIINNNGTIFHRDAGEKTREVFEAMTEFNPDPKEGWVEWK